MWSETTIKNNTLDDDTIQEQETIQDFMNTRSLFSFLFGGNRKTCNCRCGIPNRYDRILHKNREKRLVGGEYLRVHEFPWLALVNVRGQESFGGVIINDRYILTAANFLIGVTPYEVKVTLGVHDRCVPDISSANVSVQNIIIHPDFTLAQRIHDIALLRLSNIIPFERRINPICLPTPGNSYLGQIGTVAGWAQGPTPQGQSLLTCRPRKSGLPILGEECSTSSTHFTHQGCLGIVGALSVVCKIDSGGPVQFRTLGGVYEIIGILTDINECSEEPSTALYSKVNYYLPWIIKHTGDACYCQKVY
ncbi:serine protease 55-like [Chrysoperla carnea]|uniref:serine protease 55-like n=1 Tax=Chrysoperla carnea TaxID=189513 RepID=UPI001D065C3E|nr:serine protease 55-like [Chrysoperla carnea]